MMTSQSFYFQSYADHLVLSGDFSITASNFILMTLLSSLFKALNPLPVVRICYSLTTCKPAKYVFARWHFIVFEVYERVKSDIFGTYCSKNGSVNAFNFRRKVFYEE